MGKKGKFDYKGWFNAKSLPEWREDEQGIVAGPKEYIFNATKRWMNPKGMGAQYGIDGWRLDVAFCVDHTFLLVTYSLAKQRKVTGVHTQAVLMAQQ